MISKFINSKARYIDLWWFETDHQQFWALEQLYGGLIIWIVNTLWNLNSRNYNYCAISKKKRLKCRKQTCASDYSVVSRSCNHAYRSTSLKGRIHLYCSSSRLYKSRHIVLNDLGLDVIIVNMLYYLVENVLMKLKIFVNEDVHLLLIYYLKLIIKKYKIYYFLLLNDSCYFQYKIHQKSIKITNFE